MERRDWLLVQTSITFVLGVLFLFGLLGPAPLAGFAVLEGDGVEAASSGGFRLLGLLLALASVVELAFLGMAPYLRNQRPPAAPDAGEDVREAARVISARPRE
jgi:hypothetical protein